MWNKILIFSIYCVWAPLLMIIEFRSVSFEYYTPDTKQMLILFCIYFYLSAPIFIVGEKLNTFDPSGLVKYKKIIFPLLIIWGVGLIVFAYVMSSVVEYDL